MSFDIRNLVDELPENWGVCKVSDLANINSKNITKNNHPESINYIDISSISDEKITNVKYIDYSQAPSRAKRIVNNNDIIISTVRPNLKQYVVLENIPENTIASTGFCVISSKKENHVWFLYSFLTSDIFNEYLIRIADGAAYPSFNSKEIEDAIIPKPPEDIIAKINFLAKYLNQKITLNNQINETLEAMAQAIFKSWFIDFEPVKAKIEAKDAGQDAEGILLAAMSAISGKDSKALKTLQTTAPEEYAELKAIAEQFPDSLEESELGMIPKGWEVSILKNEVNITYGKNLPTKNLLKEGYPVFGGNGEIGKYNKYLYELPQVIIACRGAASGKVQHTLPFSFVTNNSLILEHEKSDFPFGYLYYFLKNKDLTAYVSGSAQPQLTIASLDTFRILKPQENILKNFDRIYISLFLKKMETLQQNQTLTELRDTLLPKLLSGEIDVSNVEIDELLENEA